MEKIAPEAVRVQLQRIVTCREFDASDRNRRFLQYVIEETLAGRAERIKAYNIATSTFGRDASFDAAADPIIRIEASRLRRSLERYYLTAGQHDPIRIEIPKGSYIPAFLSVSAHPPTSDLPIPEPGKAGSAVAGSSAGVTATTNSRQYKIAAAMGLLLGVLLLAWLGIAWSGQYPPFSHQRQVADATDRPAVFVAPFDNDGGNASDDGLIRGLTREVIVGLARFDGLFVYGPDANFRHGTGAYANPVHDLPVKYVLTAGVTVSEDRIRAAILLIDTKTGRNVWSNIFERDIPAGTALDAREAIANQIVLTLAQPDGILFSGAVSHERAIVQASLRTTLH